MNTTARITCAACGYYLDTDAHFEACYFSNEDWQYEYQQMEEMITNWDELDAQYEAERGAELAAEQAAEARTNGGYSEEY